MKPFCPAKARYRPVRRPVNSPGDGGAILLSDRENPRWRSAAGSMPAHRARAFPARPSVGITVGKALLSLTNETQAVLCITIA
jgi:hypothetical protein